MASRPRRRILVVNPNSNEVVTKGLAEALAPVAFADGPDIDCLTLKRGPLRHRDAGARRERDPAAAAAGGGQQRASMRS